MYYSFNSEIAEVYGVDEAIFLNNMIFWVAKNKANNKNFHDGYYWTYNSHKALAELFPFWNEDKIRRIIKKLKEKGVLLVGNYNKSAYDRTGWYSIDERLLETQNLHSAKMRNGSDKNAGTIPDIKPDKKQDIYICQQSNPSFDCKAITEDAKQEENIAGSQGNDSVLANNYAPLENNNNIARQDIEYNLENNIYLVPNQEIVNRAIRNWNRIANDYELPEIKVMTDLRLSKLKIRVKQAGGWKKFWNIVDEAIEKSSFLRGCNGEWRATFDFTLQESSFIKLMEKTYD